jgi:hypothetical protein
MKQMFLVRGWEGGEERSKTTSECWMSGELWTGWNVNGSSCGMSWRIRRLLPKKRHRKPRWDSGRGYDLGTSQYAASWTMTLRLKRFQNRLSKWTLNWTVFIVSNLALSLSSMNPHPVNCSLPVYKRTSYLTENKLSLHYKANTLIMSGEIIAF